MQMERSVARKKLAPRRGIRRGALVRGFVTAVVAGVLLINLIAPLRHCLCIQEDATGRSLPAGSTSEASVERPLPSGPVFAASAGNAFKETLVTLRDAAVTQIDPEAGCAAILCLALAAMLLILRHARLRLTARTQAEASDRELQHMQSQLVQSEKLASIGQLAAGVAHEMNTPLGYVACNFETLEGYVKKVLALLDGYDRLAQIVESSDKEQQLQALQTIEQLKQQMQLDLVLRDIEGLFEDSKEGLDRVAKIIQSLRDFSRVDQAGDLANYNINEGITATLTVAQNELRGKAEVETELGDVPEICCHPGQINQVFLNVLINATQAIDSQQREGPGRIRVRTFAADGFVVCEIEDDGPGIPADRLHNVFDPFFTTKPAGQGAGLGLSVAHDIIANKHNGQLLVESTEGQRTQFTIKLPVTPVKVAQEKPEPALIGAETDG
jgi:signal transduction histidine kinase